MAGEYDKVDGSSEERTHGVADATNTRPTSAPKLSTVETKDASGPNPYESYLDKAKDITESQKNENTSRCMVLVRNKFLKFLKEEMPEEEKVEEAFLKKEVAHHAGMVSKFIQEYKHDNIKEIDDIHVFVKKRNSCSSYMLN